MSRFALDTDRRFVFEGRAWQYRVLLFGLSLSPHVFAKVTEGALAPLREVGIRILNCLKQGPHARTVVRSQGPGALAPQPVGALCQLGKEQALPRAEKLFSQYAVRLGECGGTSHQRACPIHADLPEFLQRQDGGTTETLSEAPGAYGIHSRSLAARIASYGTTSAQVTLPSPEMGMSPRYSSRGQRIAAHSAPGRTLSIYGLKYLRTSVSACHCHDGCLQCGLVRYMQRAGSLGFLDRASSDLTHQLPRVAGSAAWLARVGPHRQHCGCFVHQLAGLSTITSHVTTRPSSPPLESDAAQIAARRPHPGGAQSCSRCALTTAHIPWRMATPSRDNPAVLESIRGSSGKPGCLPRPVV